MGSCASTATSHSFRVRPSSPPNWQTPRRRGPGHPARALQPGQGGRRREPGDGLVQPGRADELHHQSVLVPPPPEGVVPASLRCRRAGEPSRATDCPVPPGGRSGGTSHPRGCLPPIYRLLRRDASGDRRCAGRHGGGRILRGDRDQALRAVPEAGLRLGQRGCRRGSSGDRGVRTEGGSLACVGRSSACPRRAAGLRRLRPAVRHGLVHGRPLPTTPSPEGCRRWSVRRGSPEIQSAGMSRPDR